MYGYAIRRSMSVQVWRPWASRWCHLALVMGVMLITTTQVVESKPARRKKSANSYGASITSFLAVVKWTALLTLAPVLLYFIYTVATDPDLPRIGKYLWQSVKNKWLSYLGTNSNHHKKAAVAVDPQEEDEEEDEPYMRDYYLVHPLQHQPSPEPKKVR